MITQKWEKGKGKSEKKFAFLAIKNARRFSASGLLCGGRILTTAGASPCPTGCIFVEKKGKGERSQFTLQIDAE
jgi:hypothetical protein